MPKANICLIGLSNHFVDKYAFELSKKLDMFYANTSQIIQFELFDLNKMEEVCGKEYLEKKETSIIKRVCKFENTVLNVEYHLLNNQSNYNIIKENCLIIYLKLNLNRYKKEIEKENLSEGSNILNIDLFNDRDFICSNNADIVVDCKHLQDDELIDSIMKNLLDYYEQ